MGSHHAQEKINWKNRGLGFEIMSTNQGFMVCSARKGRGIQKGMYLKSINGKAVPRTWNVGILSEQIGALSPGESVAVEFTNGKTINLMVQGL